MKIAKNESLNIRKKSIIYISPEYGYDENINNYAGGLGILAGDYLKEASDQNFPITAVGLFYKDGYFTQSFDNNYNQISNEAPINLDDNNYQIIKENGKEKIFSIKLSIGMILFKVYKTKVKNIDLYLINSNVEDNLEFFGITNTLYTSSRKERLLQEILLGQGAMILLDYLKIPIDILHINEGHASFALLERMNNLTDINNNFDFSFNEIKKSNLFTTHTPIIHGNEEFEINLLKEILDNSSLLRYLNFDKFLELGQTKDITNFSMTVFAIRLSHKYNSVSQLHQKVATKMWKVIDENIKFENITNGIYIKDWLAPELEKFFEHNTKNIEELVEAKNSLKRRIIQDINENKFYNNSHSLLNLYAKTKIDEDSFIIGFARRFAPYKRADLLFTDIEKLKSFFKNYPKAILIISGKAHPADVDGKKIIKDILSKIQDNKLQNNIIFIENYNIKIAEKIIWASDIWLNNPIRGLEACGTSGMKAALNGSINFSILDGWWDEIYHKSIGFKIGNRRINSLENKEIANFILEGFDHLIEIKSNNKIEWGKLMRNSMLLINKQFSTIRMLDGYKKYLYNYQ